MAEELMWFDNPPRRRSKTRRKPPKGFKSWTAWSAHMRRSKSGGKSVAAKKRRRRTAARTAAPKRRRRRPAAAAPRHRRRRTSARAASRAGRVLRYRRNPPNFFANLPGRLMDAGLGAVQVTLGKAGARALPTLLKLPADGALGLATQVVSALAIGWVGSMISPSVGKMLLVGGLTAPIESFIKGANIPFISDALSGQDYYAVGGYPRAALSAYPTGVSGDEEESYMYPQ